MMTVFVGFAALSFDTGNAYLQKRFMQSDSDAAALAGATVLSSQLRTGPPGTACDNSVMAAISVLQQQQVNINSAINPLDPSGCGASYQCLQSMTGRQYEVVFYLNSAARSPLCPMPSSGNSNDLPWVRVDIPPNPLTAVGGGDCYLSPFNCIQITSTVAVSTLLERVFGFLYTDIGISSVAYGGPGVSTTAMNSLSANAVNLFGNNVPNYAGNPGCTVATSSCVYRCDTDIQSTNTVAMPMGLGAGGGAPTASHSWAANDRPTLYTCNTNSAGFNGVDGYPLQFKPFNAAAGSTGVDHLTLVSEGDVVMGNTEKGADTANTSTNPTPIFDATSFCDPWRTNTAGNQNNCPKFPIPSGSTSCVSPSTPSLPCTTNPFLANCGVLPTCPSTTCPVACAPVINPCRVSVNSDLQQDCQAGNQTCSTSADPPFFVCGTFTVGTEGFYMPTAGHGLYCDAYESYYHTAAGLPGAPPAGWPVCQAPPGNLAGMQMRHVASNWSNAFDTSCLPSCSAHGYPTLAAPTNPPGVSLCGGLVLNGGAIPVANCQDPNNPYQIQPGIYNWIVINHGAYTFRPGVYDITGRAAVGDCNGGTNAAAPIDICLPNSQGTLQYTATFSSTSSGVSPCGAAYPNCPVNFGMGSYDVDLCPDAHASKILGCNNMTAGVFIQHSGDGASVPVNNTVGQQNGGCNISIPSAGGDETDVSGSGVTFYFEASAGGFVSTHNVSHINLSAPVPGTSALTNGLPLLFYGAGNQFIHLDGGQSPYNGTTQSGAGYVSNGFRGIIYQVPTATDGGVEVNSQVGLYDYPVITGQVFARNMLVYGDQPGVIVDFTQGWGPGNTKVVPTPNGVNSDEPVEFNGGSLQIVPIAGVNYYQFDVHYFDELPLNAWSTYVTINDGAAIYLSRGLWPTPPGPDASFLPNPPASWVPSGGTPANWNSDLRWNYAHSGGGGNTVTVTFNDPNNIDTPPGTTITISPDTGANPLVDQGFSWGWGTQFSPGNPANQLYNSYTDVLFQTPANLVGNPVFKMFMYDGDGTCPTGSNGDIAEVQATLGLAQVISLEA